MLSAKQFYSELEAEGLLRFKIDVGSVEEAKSARKSLIVQQKKLRLKKREISQIKKSLRTEHSLKSRNAGSGGSVVLSLLGQRGMARSWRAASKTDLRAELTQTIATYDEVIDRIDSHILQLDEAKLKIDQYIANAQRKD